MPVNSTRNIPESDDGSTTPEINVEFKTSTPKCNEDDETCAPVTDFQSSGCTVLGEEGDGTKRGTCNQNFICHAGGLCKPTCTVLGQAGDGTKRGSCNQNFNCYPDGICKPICLVNGSSGDGINQGTCNKGLICFRDGSCYIPERNLGDKQTSNKQRPTTKRPNSSRGINDGQTVKYDDAVKEMWCKDSKPIWGRNGCMSDEECLGNARGLCDKNPNCFGVSWFPHTKDQKLKVCTSREMVPKRTVHKWRTMMKVEGAEAIQLTPEQCCKNDGVSRMCLGFCMGTNPNPRSLKKFNKRKFKGVCTRKYEKIIENCWNPTGDKENEGTDVITMNGPGVNVRSRDVNSKGD